MQRLILNIDAEYIYASFKLLFAESLIQVLFERYILNKSYPSREVSCVLLSM